MIQGIWGLKVGMTQVFGDDSKVVPVTVVNTAGWFVTQIKTVEVDGYNAIQVACLRKKYQGQSFSAEWLKKLKQHCLFIKEISITELPEGLTVGSSIDLGTILAKDDSVDATGITKGCGFAGVMKRWGFGGGPKSHGSTFSRKPGSIGNMRATGKVIKGKKMPGHMGDKQRTTQKLQVVQVRSEDNIVLVKGSMAGKPGSLVFLSKRG
ncbi:50S ribosomal protein L3 [Candidatus Chromulinivorax destructor]|uniref:50S ribosomal protein L3 n=1 Tax=Candidatus Chromulinivorax destructor TaxID=2066483 RepID=A0A345ZB01_9BACT|nr:50S ribosomal protein L3 [Candidatus Chromulinivorax destructor]AXK60468.1 50S ribosomal protein L3 [Candidatus Chromulinivorax destructor]